MLWHKPGKCYIKGMKETKPQMFLKGLSIQTFVTFKDLIFFKIYLWPFYAFIWTGQCRVDRNALGEERGEWDRQRTMSRDSNSGRRVCRRTNREAIGADTFKKYLHNIQSLS